MDKETQLMNQGCIFACAEMVRMGSGSLCDAYQILGNWGIYSRADAVASEANENDIRALYPGE